MKHIRDVMKNKSVKALVIALLCYPLLVLLFESSLGYFQPETVSTLQITTVGSAKSLPRGYRRYLRGGSGVRWTYPKRCQAGAKLADGPDLR